ncbi:hypothetical protein CsSME_00051939 [Camellia sinensis var. sinensis]
MKTRIGDSQSCQQMSYLIPRPSNMAYHEGAKRGQNLTNFHNNRTKSSQHKISTSIIYNSNAASASKKSTSEISPTCSDREAIPWPKLLRTITPRLDTCCTLPITPSKFSLYTPTARGSQPKKPKGAAGKDLPEHQ